MDLHGILTLAIVGMLGLLFVTVGGLMVYLGIFREIIVKAGKSPARKFKGYYRFKRGDYRDSGTLFEETSKIAPDLRTFGIYYDNPETTAPANRRYIVGAIVEEDGKPVLSDLEKLKTLEKSLVENNYKEIEIPDVDATAFAQFPWKTNFSILVAVNRVYSAMNAFIKEKELVPGPFLELYDRPAQVISFITPLEKQDQFFVLECLEANHDEDYEELSPESDDDNEERQSAPNSRQSSRASSRSRKGSDEEER